MENTTASTSTVDMAKIKKVRKPQPRKTVHTKSMTYKVEERAPDIRLRNYEQKPYK